MLPSKKQTALTAQRRFSLNLASNQRLKTASCSWRGPTISQPDGLVQTYGDHRMQMTALVLAMGCPSTVLVEGSELHEVADPEAVQRWKAAGTIETVLHEPWQ